MDPKGKTSAPTPPYRRDAQKGYLPSVPFPHAGPEPSGQAPQSFLKGNSLEGLCKEVDQKLRTLGVNRDGTLRHEYNEDKWRLVPLGHWNWNWNDTRKNYPT